MRIEEAEWGWWNSTRYEGYPTWLIPQKIIKRWPPVSTTVFFIISFGCILHSDLGAPLFWKSQSNIDSINSNKLGYLLVSFLAICSQDHMNFSASEAAYYLRIYWNPWDSGPVACYFTVSIVNALASEYDCHLRLHYDTCTILSSSRRKASESF